MEPAPNGSLIRQTAIYEPAGLLGRATGIWFTRSISSCSVECYAAS